MKISKIVGIMYKVRPSVPDFVLINMYYILEYPYLIYCNIIWGGTFDENINKLKLLQKKLLRIMTNSTFLAHTDPLFYRTKILKIEDIHTYLLSIHAFKNQNHFPSYDHNYYTRNRNNLVTAFHRLKGTKRAVSYSAPHEFNKLPIYIKQCTKISEFKVKLKQYLIDSYKL
jgi:hypothetical protein